MRGFWSGGPWHRRRRSGSTRRLPSWLAERLGPVPVASGIRARSRRGAIGETWWSQRWVAVLESFGLGSRLARGRAYARRGQVLEIDVQPGVVRARVQGTRPAPYRVEIRVAPLTDRQWGQVVRVLARQASFAASLLAGEMPPNIEEAFQAARVSLFPSRLTELRTSCSCLDWANPCKHVAAVYYLLAEALDRDPFVIFTLRGRTQERIIEQLRALRAEAAARPGHSRAAASGKHDGALAVAHPEPVTARTGGSGEPQGALADLAADPLLQALRQALADLTAPPLEDSLDLFWGEPPGGAHDDTAPPAEAPGRTSHTSFSGLARPPAPPAVDGAVLRFLGPAPVEVGDRNLAEALLELYAAVTRFAVQEAVARDDPESGA